MPSTSEKLQRVFYREFLLEPGLYQEVGLETLPGRLAALLRCSELESVSKAVESPLLESLTINELKELIIIRDMSLVSRTAAAVSAELKEGAFTYHDCCRTALCYAVIGSQAHVFSALRAAAGKNDAWARHHYFYGLMLGIANNMERAHWELGIALQNEPYEDGKIRIRWAMDILDGRI
jgi:hypothetical protein